VAHTTDNQRVAFDGEKNKVVVRARDFGEDSRIVGGSADAGELGEARYGVFDGCGDSRGRNGVIARDMCENFVRFGASRCCVTNFHAP
jgi:hypothetical protein